MEIFSSIIDDELNKEREKRNFTHEKYLEQFLDLVDKRPENFVGDIYEPDFDNPSVPLRDSAGNVRKPVEYNGETVTISPEPLTYLHYFDDISNDQEKCKRLLTRLINESKLGFQRVELNQKPNEGIWFNETSNGVNIRPGLEDGERTKPVAITLGDENVHSLIAGRTGSGKSVFLNNIIFNLLTEYSPWELDLYLADFKKVELSRYLTKYSTPQVKAVAATSEIRYVISMLEYLVQCMHGRQDFFTRVGVQKISDFRDKFQVVLPRIVLVVDEFQQMFQEATYSEGDTIRDLLTSITKLGRATGFHLVFASQDMSGSLPNRVMTNFKVRFALPSEASVSSDVLGNSAASDLGIGYVLANTESGSAEDNRRFRVPLIQDDEKILDDGSIIESYFYEKLAFFQEEAKKFTFEKQKNFYQEDYQLPIEKLEDVLEEIQETRNNKVQSLKNQYFDVFTLGRGVVYSNKLFDLETFFIEYGMNKNILAVTHNIDELSYIQKLLAINFKFSPHDYVSHHLFNLNPIINAKKNLADDIEFTNIYESAEDLEKLHKKYVSRKAIENAYNSTTLEGFLEKYIEILSDAFSNKKRYEEYKNFMLQFYDGYLIEDYQNRTTELHEVEGLSYGFLSPVLYFIASYENGFEGQPEFTQEVYWVSSVDYIDRLPNWYEKMMRDSMTLNILLINFSSSEDISSGLISRSEYIFISGNNERLYNRCGVDFTRKTRGSIVVDFKIRSLNTQRSFKKYKVEENQVVVPALDFDLILGGK